MSLRRPTVACLLFIYFISPLCGVAQTPDCGMFIIYFIILIFYVIAYLYFNMLVCIRVLFIIGDWRYVPIIFSAHHYHIMPVFIMFASTFKVLTGLSLAIVLARFLAWRGALWRQPRNLRNGDSSLAKIGVILVSCSCGKWSPIDADVPNRFRPQPLVTKCCTPKPKWSCTTYFLYLLGILVSSWYLIS